jgi:hydrogenase maturation protein HypF
VSNSGEGVLIEVEGPGEALKRFSLRLEEEAPPRASIQALEASYLEPLGYADFKIRPSRFTGAKTALVLPDIATCQECVQEIFDPGNRRYRYPFTNCTNCGPRFSIVEARPYDRANTTMKGFVMCDGCLAEYRDPDDRRYHAQPNACPQCGPRLELWDADGKRSAQGDVALREASDRIRQGAILAVKGIGGFHLVTNARSEDSVARLRRRKHREERPFALMYPSLKEIARDCELSALEARLLRSPEAPIVLLTKRQRSDSQYAPIAASVAPRYPTLGAMLPYSPLHHLLLSDLGTPVVATSGNLSDEPICTDPYESLERLHGIAEGFLVHDRPIARHVDDSVTQVMMGRDLVLRRGRGFAPLPLDVDGPPRSHGNDAAATRKRKPAAGSSERLLAVGGHFKSAIAITNGPELLTSQHIGDLETAQAHAAFRKVIVDFETLYEHRPDLIACDLHPDYLSTHFAQRAKLPVLSIQHHHAHVAACMADNGLEAKLLGVAWDGAGLGTDGSIWGGEFLHASRSEFTRFAHLRRFRLPGGDAVAREPWRAAIGLLYEIYGDAVFDRTDLPSLSCFASSERRILREMLRGGINAPYTSSAGRLFDAIAALIGLTQKTSYEGQAAIELEFASLGSTTRSVYPFHLTTSDDTQLKATDQTPPCVVNWQPMIQEILDECASHVPHQEIAARFHSTLAAIIVTVAQACNENRVVLTGGCFQNRVLTELAVSRLEAADFQAFWHQRIPPNDGGIAIGQAVVALSSVTEES